MYAVITYGMAGPSVTILTKREYVPDGADCVEVDTIPDIPADGKRYEYRLDVERREVYLAEVFGPASGISALRATKLTHLSAAGNAAIVAGVDATLPSTGEAEHFSLMETDQINLSTAMVAVEQGAAGYPYHADGQLCRLYPAADILAISDAAIRHKLYHTTYCNHLLVWARRAETVEELEGIAYGAELPPDLAENLAAVLAAAGGGVNA